MRNKILLVCMILGSFAAVNKSHATGKDKVTPGYKEVIDNYIEGYLSGNYKTLDKVLSDDANVKIPRADAVLVHSKNKLMEQMKSNGSVKQNCGSQYKVLDKSDALVIAVIDFKYTDFTQHNYVVLEKNENKEWKITQVCKFFEDKRPADQPLRTEPAPSVTASR